MPKENWHSMRRFYEENPSPSSEEMLWLIDQIIESQYSNIFFPGRSLDSLHIALSNDWRDKGKLPTISVNPKRSWITIRYCRFNEAGDPVDEYKITNDQLDQTKKTLFALLNCLERWQVSE